MVTKSKAEPKNPPLEIRTVADADKRLAQLRQEAADAANQAVSLHTEIAHLRARGAPVPDLLYVELSRAERDRDSSGLVIQIIEDERAALHAEETSDA